MPMENAISTLPQNIENSDVIIIGGGSLGKWLSQQIAESTRKRVLSIGVNFEGWKNDGIVPLLGGSESEELEILKGLKNDRMNALRIKRAMHVDNDEFLLECQADREAKNILNRTRLAVFIAGALHENSMVIWA